MVDETKLNDSNQAGNVVSAGEGNAADAKRRELQHRELWCYEADFLSEFYGQI